MPCYSEFVMNRISLEMTLGKFIWGLLWFHVLLLKLTPTVGYAADTVVLEFNQYTPGSRWRQALVNRKEHREEGNEGDGFYGGVRKLRSKDDISKWRQLWPTDILE